MIIGYYWVKKEEKYYPGFWDGEKFKHFHGDDFLDKCEIVSIVPFSCPTGCTCTVNSDGSVTTHCQ